MRKKPQPHTIDTLFTVLLLLSFLLFSMLVAGTGSMVYQKSTDSLNRNYTSRTALSYLTEKLRQHDQSGDIAFTQLDNIPALALYEEQNETRYCTYLYFYNGALRELFTQASTTPSVDMGTAIAELADFTFCPDPASESSTLLLTVTDADGSSDTARIHLSSTQNFSES